MKHEVTFLAIKPAPHTAAGEERYTLGEIETALVEELEQVRQDIVKSLRGPAQPTTLLPATLQEHPCNEILTELRKSYHKAVAKILTTEGEERAMWESVRNDAIRFLLQFAGDFFGTAEFHAWLRER